MFPILFPILILFSIFHWISLMLRDEVGKVLASVLERLERTPGLGISCSPERRTVEEEEEERGR